MASFFDWILLKEWFGSRKRDLPWRRNPTPYQVWISEVMLQQTQVATVIPYYENWMRQYPTVQHLAAASLDEVIKCWEGLGYYSRARSLHAGAQYIVEYFDGQVPSTSEALATIKGIGPYTVGAILSFAYHQKAAAVDGNVMRVLARYFNIHEDLCKSSTIKKLRLLAEEILPEDEPWVVSEALIELGATLCRRKPQCFSCPLKGSCQGYIQGSAAQLPFKAKKTILERLYRTVAVIRCENQWLIRRGQPGEIMTDLHEFPYFESVDTGESEKKVIKQIEASFGLAVSFQEALQPISHGFTRYQVKLYPYLFESRRSPSVENFIWMPLSQLQKLAFSAGHRKILEQIGCMQKSAKTPT